MKIFTAIAWWAVSIIVPVACIYAVLGLIAMALIPANPY